MNDQLHSFIDAFGTTIPLEQLVSNLVNDSLPAANHNKTIVVNEVEQGIALGTNMQHAIGIMSDILTTIVINSNKGDIHIQQKGSGISSLLNSRREIIIMGMHWPIA